ncbi:MAG TPA: Smr/MutS family protein [Methylibium sp.]|uniref:Smr/MutS family protein n=1 Tax=Methylibium sp. TaxID=2067992 RepID=UPI002DBFDBB3|nr:Smr/MutS family protein [Methylibium sp.]HEU4458532.1 Smr/MutS family protein [Methylibium sp.]
MDGLRELQRTLQSLEREAQAETAARRERERREQLERELFARSVGPVWPLRAGARAELARERPAPLPLQRLRDEQAVMREALSDDFDVESLLDTDEALSWRRSEIGAEVVRKLRRGVWATQAQVDLHGLRRDEARERLADFLREAGKHGLRCVRVVHGKGHGSPGRQAVLKGKVKSWLVQKAEVLAFVQARASEGGAGALIVLLATRVVGAATSAPADSRASRR